MGWHIVLRGAGTWMSGQVPLQANLHWHQEYSHAHEMAAEQRVRPTRTSDCADGQDTTGAISLATDK
jgi:hypothetical protein